MSVRPSWLPITRPPTLQFLGIGFITGILAAGMIAFAVRGFHHSGGSNARSKSPATKENVQPEKLAVSLTAETHQTKSGSIIQLHWDTSAEPIRRSSHGMLYIYDGGIPNQQVLDRRALDSGSAEYTPVSDEVTFHLILPGGRPTGEFLMVLLGKREGRDGGLHSEAAQATPNYPQR
jgi:hypothetical protein